MAAEISAPDEARLLEVKQTPAIEEEEGASLEPGKDVPEDEPSMVDTGLPSPTVSTEPLPSEEQSQPVKADHLENQSLEEYTRVNTTEESFSSEQEEGDSQEKGSLHIQETEEVNMDSADEAMPQALSAPMGNAPNAETVTYPLTLRVYDGRNPDGSEKYRTESFTSPDQPLPHPLGRNNWAYKTYKIVFFGWTTVGPDLGNAQISPDTPIYRASEPVSAIPDLTPDTILYPVWTDEGGILAIGAMLEANSGDFAINRDTDPEEVLPGSTINNDPKETVWEDVPYADSPITRKVSAYYDQEKER